MTKERSKQKAVKQKDVSGSTEKIDVKAVVAQLAKMSPLEYDQIRENQAAFIGVRVTTLDAAVKKARKPSAAEAPGDAQKGLEELEESALPIIESDDVLGLFDKTWSKIMAGEHRNARRLYLMATTRLFDRCMSAAIKGPSGAGKSEIRQRVLDFFPEEDVIAFTTMSERALLYMDGDFQHKILSMGEAAGAVEQSLQDYLLRELISAGRLLYPVSQKIGNEIVTTTIEKRGPVCFFVTTTKAALHPENETRMMSLEVDDSGGQTTKILGKVAEIVGLNSAAAAINLEPWRNYQRWLAAGNCIVVVPFAAELAKLIPPRAVRLRRDFPQILLAIKAHALIHRAHRVEDERGQIVAELEADYGPVAELFGDIVAEASGTAIGKEVQETIDAVKQATLGMSESEGTTAQAIGKRLKLDKSAARRRLLVAQEKGFVRNLEERRFQPGRYRLAYDELEAEPLLPSIAAVEEAIAQSTLPKSAQPCHRTEKHEESYPLNGGRDEHHPSATDSHPLAGHGDQVASSNATVKSFREKVKVASVARLHAFPAGQAETCTACDGGGCPTCQPEAFWPELEAAGLNKGYR